MEIIKQVDFINFKDLEVGDVFTSIYNRDDYLIRIKDITLAKGEEHDLPKVNATNLDFNNFYFCKDTEKVVKHKAVLKIEP